MTRILVRLTTLLSLLLLGSATAFAQIGDSSLPIDIEADNAEAIDVEKRIVWTGNVHAVQGDSSLRADRLEVYYTGEAGGGGPHPNMQPFLALSFVIAMSGVLPARG